MVIAVRNVYKVFGADPRKGVEKLRSGTTRDELRRSGYTAAVDNASFDVQAGEIFVIMGLSGSGKSTLVRTLNRLHEPTSGTVQINGVDVGSLNAKDLRALRAEQVSMVFQHFALLPHRTVRDNAAFGLAVRHVPKEERLERADRALLQAGLSGWGDSYPDELSGGMRQRVGLARALATEAEILLMDEAFSALDPLIKREMQDQLIELQSELKRTIVFITHDLNEAMRLGDRIAVMRDGAIVQIGTPEEILQTPVDEYVASFVQDVDRSKVLTADGVMRDPVATISSREGPAAALRKMRELQVSALFVLSPNRRLMGMVDDESMAELVKRGEHRLDATLSQDGLVKVTPDTFLAELLLPAATNILPIAVVDDDDILRGVIPRAALLEGLSDTTGQVPVVSEDDAPVNEPVESLTAGSVTDG